LYKKYFYKDIYPATVTGKQVPCPQCQFTNKRSRVFEEKGNKVYYSSDEEEGKES
jgi:hypothetical protein